MTIAAVHLWGRVIGAVVLEEGQPAATFQYDEQFARSEIQVAPLMMPLRDEPYSFPALSYESFKGLPGLLVDSLPDKFGNALIDVWLAQQQRSIGSFDAVERLRQEEASLSTALSEKRVAQASLKERHVSSAVTPAAETIPMPVTTTSLFMERFFWPLYIPR